MKQFLDHFRLQLDSIQPCQGYLPDMDREMQIAVIHKIHAVSNNTPLTDDEAESLLDRKISEYLPHIGDYRLFFAVRSLSAVEILAFWLSEAEQLEGKYEFTDMLDWGSFIPAFKEVT